jgi:tRNA/rRNA methyltransferase
MENKIRIVLVEPRHEGNVGSVARVMKNFGQNDLALVRPCKLKDFAFAMAVHSSDVLQSAKVFESVEDAIRGSHTVVGTTAKSSGETEFVRKPAVTPGNLKKMIKGNTSILFGREDFGLSREELKRCDIVVTIPADEDYPTMNISHAVTVVLYELMDTKKVGVNKSFSMRSIEVGVDPMAAREDRERLLSHCERVLTQIQYPPHRMERTLVMLRRIFAKANLTKYEVSMLRGILRKTEWKIRAKK